MDESTRFKPGDPVWLRIDGLGHVYVATYVKFRGPEYAFPHHVQLFGCETFTPVKGIELVHTTTGIVLSRQRAREVANA